MANEFYKNTNVFDNMYYRVPKFIYQDFSDIPGKEFLVQEGDRLDAIAEQIYGNSNYWRAIAVYNDIGYFFDVRPGMVIKLPTDIKQVLARL
jgi:hypothetical protein